MNALPHASAGPAFHSGIIAGKLNGVMPATTPSGWRIEYTSMPPPAPSVNSPLSRCGMPMANSMTSMPRWMSPRESGTVLPCSIDSSSASSSVLALTSSMNFISTRARRCGFQAAHSFCASTADGHRGVDVGGRRQQHLRLHLAGAGVEHVGGAGGLRGRCACRR